MIKTVKLPEKFIAGTAGASSSWLVGPMAEKCTLDGIDEIQHLYVAPWTSIKMHGHGNQWEVWVRITHKTAHVCLIGEEHELVNNSGACMTIMAIKGHVNYSYNEKRDLDNICFAKKFILDALVKARVLENDNKSHIHGFIDKFEYANKSKVIVELEEI